MFQLSKQFNFSGFQLSRFYCTVVWAANLHYFLWKCNTTLDKEWHNNNKNQAHKADMKKHRKYVELWYMLTYLHAYMLWDSSWGYNVAECLLPPFFSKEIGYNKENYELQDIRHARPCSQIFLLLCNQGSSFILRSCTGSQVIFVHMPFQWAFFFVPRTLGVDMF